MKEFLGFSRALFFVVLLAGLIWLASGLRWPGFSDPNGDWFRLVSQLSATSLGAAIAGGVTWYFAERKRRDEQRASLHRLFLRLLYLSGGLTNLLRTIDEMLADANDANATNLPLWARVKPIVGMPREHELDVADLTPLMDAKDFGIVNEMILLDDRNRSNLEAINTYNRLRVELRDLMTPTGQTGPVSHTALTKDEYLKLKPRFDELDQLVSSVLQHLREDVPFAERVITAYTEKAAHVVGKFPKIQFLRRVQTLKTSPCLQSYRAPSSCPPFRSRC